MDEYTDEMIAQMRAIAMENSFDFTIEGRSFNHQIDDEEEFIEVEVISSKIGS